MTKINSISIKGLRGVSAQLDLSLGGNSALFYGDNGSGKSTISDIVEWFFLDEVKHLSGEEIGRKGQDAMRNATISDDAPASAELKFTNKNFNAIKTIEIKNKKLNSSISNDNTEFKNYMNSSCRENLILRFTDLVKFVLSTKKEKLDELSNIIGYASITETRDVLRSSRNVLEKEIKNKSFDNSISHQQRQIIEQLQQNITTDSQFIQIVNKLIEPFNLDSNVSELKDINTVLKKIKKPDESKEINQETFLVKLSEKIISVPVNLDDLEDQYKRYKEKFDDLVIDIDKIKKLILEKLFTTGKEILEDDAYSDDNCPLCLVDQSKEDLLNSLVFRINELQEVKLEQEKLEELKAGIKKKSIEISRVLEAFLSDAQIDEESNVAFKKSLEELIGKIKKFEGAIKNKPEAGANLPAADTLLIERSLITSMQDSTQEQLKVIRDKRKSDPKWDAYSKINVAGHAYAEINRLKKEKGIYETQLDSLDGIYADFLKCQKEALEAFLGAFSESINEIYQFLNPNERVDNIRLVPINKDDELAGITIQFDFLDNKDVSPPHKYLSESHLNCLGIAFFLTSVEAFNKQNKFFVLDDVISSFDSTHRKRFADLLIERYSEYQIVLLTHEKAWFDIVQNLIKGKNWIVNTIKHSVAKGSYIDESPQSLKEKIEAKISASNEDGLGNDARKYLEHILKNISLNLEVKLPYRFNDVNEDRMAFELLTELIGTLKKTKCDEIRDNPIFGRLLGSTFIGNKDSHDSTYVPKFSDMKAFWLDVCDLEKLFFCNKCASYLSLRNYDAVTKKIRCKKGDISYSWIK